MVATIYRWIIRMWLVATGELSLCDDFGCVGCIRRRRGGPATWLSPALLPAAIRGEVQLFVILLLLYKSSNPTFMS